MTEKAKLLREEFRKVLGLEGLIEVRDISRFFGDAIGNLRENERFVRYEPLKGALRTTLLGTVNITVRYSREDYLQICKKQDKPNKSLKDLEKDVEEWEEPVKKQIISMERKGPLYPDADAYSINPSMNKHKERKAPSESKTVECIYKVYFYRIEDKEGIIKRFKEER